MFFLFGHLVYFTAIFCGHLVYFSSFGMLYKRKIWQPCSTAKKHIVIFALDLEAKTSRRNFPEKMHLYVKWGKNKGLPWVTELGSMLCKFWSILESLVFGIFYGTLVYFIAIGWIVLQFCKYCGNLVCFVVIWYNLSRFGKIIWYVLWSFGIIFPVLVCCSI
jgi:hypothetical protein